MKNRCTHGAILKSLATFTIPLILSGMLQQIFNWVDAFIVGNTEGELALAGIGATTSFYNLFVTVIVGFTSGISVFAAQTYGKGEQEKLKRILSTFTILLGVIFFAAAAGGTIFAQEILTVLDTPANIFKIAQEYIRLLLAGIPCLAIYNIYSAILRSIGDSKTPFLAVLVCSVVNVILDLLFVMTFRFGAAGAAAATSVSQMTMTIFIIGYTVKKYPALRFPIRQGIWDKAIMLQGLTFGFPPAIQAGTLSAGNIALQRFMNGFGEQTVAAITTAYRVDSVIILPIVNFGSGIATIVAQNTGAGNKLQARKVLKTGLLMIMAISVCLTLFVLLAGAALIAMFGLTKESAEIGNAFFHAIARCYIVYGFAMALRGYLEGTGDMVFSGTAGMISLLVRIISSYAFAVYVGNRIIAYAEMLSWITLLALYALRFFYKEKPFVRGL